MTITQSDPWKAPPRIARDHFAAIIRTRGNPDLAFERDPGEYWDAITDCGVDPLFLLGMFNHESNMGVNGTATVTHSWGNTRAPTFGALPVGETAGRSGTFPIFRNWLDGCISTAVRLVEPTWYYHDRPDIGSIFINSGPVWAPAGDLNDPAGYLRSVLDFMNANADGGTQPMPVPYDRVHTSADIGPSRTLDSIRWFILHDTEGYFAGDEAVLTSADAPVESANFLIGREPGQCVYVVPITETAWAAGNDQVGEQAVQVEMSGFAGNGEGYTDYQYAKLAEIYRWCVGQGMVNVPPVYLGLHPADTDSGPEPDEAGIIGHAGVPNPNGLGASPAWGGVSGHVDPGPDFDWPRFIGLISGNAPPPPPPPQRTIDGIAVGEGVWQLYSSVSEATAARTRIFGVLTGPEHDEWLTTADGAVLPVVVARFERLPVLWDRGVTPAPFDVRVPGPGDKLTKAKPKVNTPHIP